MKKITYILIGLLLITSMGLTGLADVFADGPGGAGPNEKPVFIKVGLRYGDSAQTKSTFKSPSGFILSKIDDYGEFVNPADYSDIKEIEATIVGVGVVLKDNKGNVLTHALDGETYIFPYTESGYITFEERAYRGGFNLKTFGGNKVTVINVLTLEKYLYGVVHREMGQSNPKEALKAQAITARTYAVLNKNRHRTNGFDVCAGTHCQVYGGVKDEYTSTVAAVNETEGMMIYLNGKPVDTYYSKNSGGFTQNSEDVWSSRLAHLRSKPDPYSPVYSWEATIKYDAMRQMLQQGGLDPGNINKIEITERNSSFAVHSMEITGSLGKVTLTKTKVRELFGASLIKSTQFTINEKHVRPKGTSGDSLTIKTEGPGKTKSASEPVYIMGAGGEVIEKPLNDLWLHNSSRLSAVAERLSIEPNGHFEDKPVVGGSQVTFYGDGYGHGVGMAQDGAIAMAKMGMTYMDILTFYYTGVEVY